MELELDKEYYYVCPFVFTIEKVFLELNGGIDRIGGKCYYIERTGAYLSEDNIFNTIDDAKTDAFRKLNEFYTKKSLEIINNVPVLMKD